VERIGSRITHHTDKNKVATIIISPKKEPLKGALLFAWLMMWSFCGVYVMIQLFESYSKEEKLYLIIFLLFWVYFEYKAIKAYLWRKLGREMLMIDNHALSIKKAYKNYGKSTQYYLENINGLKLKKVSDRSFSDQIEGSYWSVRGERIAFNYLRKEIKFGIQLSETEARKLYGLISKRIKGNLKKE